MSVKEWISPSEADEELVCRLALRAAMKELDGFVFHEERESPAAVRQILKATHAINKVVLKASIDFAESNPGKRCYTFCGVPTMLVLASAYWACGNGIDELGMNPTCIPGQAILDFAAAIALLNAASAATEILSEGADGLFGSDDAELFLGDASSS